jgi:hypothetical protein
MRESDIIGFSGVALLLLAYLFNLLKILGYSNRLYMLMNFIGAAMACAASVMIHYLPFVLLEGVWALVSLIALLRSFLK